MDDDGTRSSSYRKRRCLADLAISGQPPWRRARLGYPLYFFAILGIWKVLGAIAILVPGFPRLKEWAYAGIFFDLTGAAASCAAVGGYGAYAFHVIAPLILTGFTVASWALRPESRTIGMLFPAKNGATVRTLEAANIG